MLNSYLFPNTACIHLEIEINLYELLLPPPPIPSSYLPPSGLSQRLVAKFKTKIKVKISSPKIGLCRACVVMLDHLGLFETKRISKFYRLDKSDWNTAVRELGGEKRIIYQSNQTLDQCNSKSHISSLILRLALSVTEPITNCLVMDHSHTPSILPMTISSCESG
jgi:hypothetical protein